MGGELKSNIQLLPPGFRFHPSDEELIVHYLRNKATSNPLPASIIAEVDLYKCSPWELPSLWIRKLCLARKNGISSPQGIGSTPIGVRPNRMAVLGYWKATGTDKPILTSREKSIIGLKKALVFYKGRPPRGVKTDWIMHEYRLPESTTSTSRGSMRLDDWVLCRVRLKSSNKRRDSEDRYSSRNEQDGHIPKADKPTLNMSREYPYKDCPMLPYIFSYPELPSMYTVSTISFKGGKASTTVCEDNSGSKYWQCPVTHFDSQFNTRKRGRAQGNQTGGSIPTRKKLNNRDKQTEQGLVAISSDTTEMSLNGVEQFGCIHNLNAMEFYNPISRLQSLGLHIS